MSLTFVTGGARSGKSAYALRLAKAADSPVAMIATAEARDAEMRERIEAHRRERPATWRTVEEPLDLAGALRGLAEGEYAVVDCLSLWTSNLLEHQSAATIERLAAEAAALAAAHEGGCVAVSSEVGLGIVPESPLGRSFRDAQGRLNMRVAERADRVILMAAGLPLVMKDRPFGGP